MVLSGETKSCPRTNWEGTTAVQSLSEKAWPCMEDNYGPCGATRVRSGPINLSTTPTPSTRRIEDAQIRLPPAYLDERILVAATLHAPALFFVRIRARISRRSVSTLSCRSGIDAANASSHLFARCASALDCAGEVPSFQICLSVCLFSLPRPCWLLISLAARRRPGLSLLLLHRPSFAATGFSSSFVSTAVLNC